MINYYNNAIGVEFDGHKDRISKIQCLEREMRKKHGLNRNQFRISVRDGCIICEYRDKGKIYH